MRNQHSRFSNVGQQSDAGRHVPESYRWRNGANAVARIAQFRAEVTPFADSGISIGITDLQVQDN
jgi:hypothetical protein